MNNHPFLTLLETLKINDNPVINYDQFIKNDMKTSSHNLIMLNYVIVATSVILGTFFIRYIPFLITLFLGIGACYFFHFDRDARSQNKKAKYRDQFQPDIDAYLKSVEHILNDQSQQQFILDHLFQYFDLGNNYQNNENHQKFSRLFISLKENFKKQCTSSTILNLKEFSDQINPVVFAQKMQHHHLPHCVVQSPSLNVPPLQTVNESNNAAEATIDVFESYKAQVNALTLSCNQLMTSPHLDSETQFKLKNISKKKLPGILSALCEVEPERLHETDFNDQSALDLFNQSLEAIEGYLIRVKNNLHQENLKTMSIHERHIVNFTSSH